MFLSRFGLLLPGTPLYESLGNLLFDGVVSLFVFGSGPRDGPTVSETAQVDHMMVWVLCFPLAKAPHSGCGHCG